MTIFRVMRLKALTRFGSGLQNVGGCRHRSQATQENQSCQLLIVGGGSAGCSLAAMFAPKLGRGKVIVLEPSDVHYYQPLFTLVGGGVCPLANTVRPMGSVLHKDAVWVKDEAIEFHPTENIVRTKGGSSINYDMLVLSLGIQLNFDKVEGLLDALETPGSGVASNYSPKYVTKTFEELKAFTNGNAVFTCPSSPIKCGGAPQKVAYLSEHYLRKAGIREDAKLLFKSGAAAFFPSPYYEKVLYKVAESREISVSLKEELVKVDYLRKTAIFQNLDSNEQKAIEFSFMHVTPHQSCPSVLVKSKDLVDAGGWVDVNKETLLHSRFENIFSLGDCSNLPTSKTGAAVARQLGVVRKNLSSALEGKPLLERYNGYTSCPLVTGYDSLILAEFDYDKMPMETLPYDQRKESRLSYALKRHVMPAIYWTLMLRGLWEGPGIVRRWINPFKLN